MVHVAFQTLHNLVQVRKCSFVAGWRNAKRMKSIRAFAQQAEIKLITSDVDGTLLDSQQRLTPLVEKAIKLSRSVGVPVSAIILPFRLFDISTFMWVRDLPQIYSTFCHSFPYMRMACRIRGLKLET